jgi:hypothetical protein
VAVSLFDHLTVRVTVSESRSHTSRVKLELVRFGIDPRMLAAGPQPRVNPTKEVLKLRQQEQEQQQLLPGAALTVPPLRVRCVRRACATCVCGVCGV